MKSLSFFCAVVTLAALAAATISCRAASYLPADQALAESRANYAEVDSVRIVIDVPRGGLFPEPLQAEVAFAEGRLAYSRYTWPDATSRITEVLFLPPDLYVRTPEGSWYVQSPWNQGVRPEELRSISFDDPPNFEELVESIGDLERAGEDVIDGKAYARFEGTGPDADAMEGETVTFWLDEETMLPRQVQAAQEGQSLTVQFLDYNTAVAVPAVPSPVQPLRDLEFPQAACIGDEFKSCLRAQTELQSVATDSCSGVERRVCIVPVGMIDVSVVQHLIEHLNSNYGLQVQVLTPLEVPEDIVNDMRGQIDANALTDFMGTRFPAVFSDPNAVMIGLTPLDLYDATSHFRYLFGLKGDAAYPKAVLSTVRMNPTFYSEPPDQNLYQERVTKLLSKYIGLLYYDLPSSDDPASLMFNNILGPDDLDRMQGTLPVATR